MVNYDLAVIGTSANAFQLLSRAVKDCAKIAWIWDRQVSDRYLNISEIHDVLQRLIINLNSYLPSERLHLFANRITPLLNKFDVDDILENISQSGIDVIVGKYRFCEKQADVYLLEVNQTFCNVDNHEENSLQIRLTARIYAIAYDQPTFLPKIFGLADHDYLTANRLLEVQELPNSIAVLGDDSHACVIAQSVNCLGVRTSLITNNSHVLPKVDVAIARTLQAQLEAEGVEIYTNSQITAVSHPSPQRSKIWLDTQTIECDRLLIPIAPNDLAIPRDRGIYQVHNQADIDLVLQKVASKSSINSVQFLPSSLISKSNSHPAITFVPTNPPLAQVGITEAYAKAQNLKSTYVLESASADRGFCKIICNHQGLILGASMVGNQAKSFIEEIAIAMQGKVKAQDLAILDEMEPIFCDEAKPRHRKY